MDRSAALAALNARLLAEYSARTISALRAAITFRVALPHLERVLALNIDKEVRKDRLVIRRAAQAAACATPPTRADALALYGDTRAIDEDFVDRTRDFPVRVVIPYSQIEPLRVARIRYLLEASYRILCAWCPERRLRAALREAYAPDDFELVLCTMLHLYARETRALAQAVQLPSALAPLRERAAAHVASVMSDTGMRLAHDVAQRLYAI